MTFKYKIVFDEELFDVLDLPRLLEHLKKIERVKRAAVLYEQKFHVEFYSAVQECLKAGIIARPRASKQQLQEEKRDLGAVQNLAVVLQEAFPEEWEKLKIKDKDIKKATLNLIGEDPTKP